jgi:hypothetical protein
VGETALPPPEAVVGESVGVGVVGVGVGEVGVGVGDGDMLGDGDIDGDGLAEQLCDGLAPPRPAGLLDGLCPLDWPEAWPEPDGPPWLLNPFGTPGCGPG